MRVVLIFMLAAIAGANALSTATNSESTAATTISSPDMTKSNLHNGGKRYLRTEETLETDDIDSDEEERKAGVDITKVLIGPKIEKLNKAAVQAAKASTVERATAAKLAERSKILRKAIDKAMQSDKLTDAAFAIWNKQGVMASTLLRQLDPSLRAKYKPFLRSYNEYVQKALTTS